MANHRSNTHGVRSEIGRIGAQLLVLVGSLLLAFGASAQQVYQLNQGIWNRNIPDGVIPFAGETPHNCDFLMRGKRATRATAMGTPLPIPQEMAAAYGCPSGAGGILTATMAGVGGAFTLPPNLIEQQARGYLVTVPIPGNPNQIQAATDGTWIIPHATRGTGTDAIGAPAYGGPGSIGPTMRVPAACVEATCTNLAPFRKFLKSAWKGGPASSTNGQTGRAGANFTWCWGNPGCTDITGASAANRMIVKYKAGPNAFGGTLSQITSTNIPGTIVVLIPGIGYLFNVLDSGAGQVQGQARGYADFLTEILTGAAQGFMTVQIMNVYEAALQATVPVITMVTNPFTPPPTFQAPQINEQYAFPLTTGTVVVRRTSPLNPGQPVLTLSAMGGDTTTTMGARNVSLVAGAVSNLSIFTANNVTLDALYMALPEPGQAGGLVAGVLGLLGLAAWRARKVRS